MPFNFSYIIPGKLAGMARPGGMADLKGEIMLLKREGIGAVVSLTEDALDAQTVLEADMGYLHLPLRDFHPPQQEQIDRFVEFVAECNSRGRAVAAHCAAGMGRTGTMLACYLVYLGEESDEAINSIRAIRPGSIETLEQEESVHEYARRRKQIEA